MKLCSCRGFEEDIIFETFHGRIIRHYYNLTQYPLLGGTHTYFRSTDVEQMNWERLLWSVPDDMLWYLSQDVEIMIHDKSSNFRGKIERIFCPVLEDLLNNIYFNDEPKNNHLREHFVKARYVLNKNKQLEKKFTYWKGLITKRVRIQGQTTQVEKEKIKEKIYGN